jgi:uncharacterized protein (UPF0303 family)
VENKIYLWIVSVFFAVTIGKNIQNLGEKTIIQSKQFTVNIIQKSTMGNMVQKSGKTFIRKKTGLFYYLFYIFFIRLGKVSGF